MSQDKHTRGDDIARQQSEEQERKDALHNPELTDSVHDQERLQSDEAILDLPDVKDIPGQEFVHVPSLDAIGDTTISSADEEGEGLFGDETDEEDV